METLAGGPIFFDEITFGYYPFKDRRDGFGWDYWVAASSGARINRQFCNDRAGTRKTHSKEIWGLIACYGP